MYFGLVADDNEKAHSTLSKRNRRKNVIDSDTEDEAVDNLCNEVSNIRIEQKNDSDEEEKDTSKLDQQATRENNITTIKEFRTTSEASDDEYDTNEHNSTHDSIKDKEEDSFEYDDETSNDDESEHEVDNTDDIEETQEEKNTSAIDLNEQNESFQQSDTNEDEEESSSKLEDNQKYINLLKKARYFNN